jgi:putative MATE family efflux protein
MHRKHAAAICYKCRSVKDLTAHSIGKHILQMALPIAAGMLFQTLYFLIDLYFVAHLGDAAIAGVSAAGNVMFIVFALTQVLGVGTVALISHAVGRKDAADATRVFNQSVSLSAVCGVLTLAVGYLLAAPYMHALGADAATVSAGIEYLWWFLPSLGLQFAIVAMGSALRGTGIVQPSMVVQMLTVLLNAVLAPVLIAGWGTGHPLGVAGAGLASSVSLALGVVLLGVYFHRLEHYVAFDSAAWRWDLAVWGRLLRIGLPAGGEFALMFIYMGVIYSIIRPFGQDAQAGFGIGMRLNQSLLLPAMAVAFATAPIVGQNFAAGKFARVRETFVRAALIGAVITAAVTLLCQWRAESLSRLFSSEPAAVAVSTQFLRLISLNFIASGFIFTCSAVFQGLGNTVPAVLSGATRLVSFLIPALWLRHQPDFRLTELWYVSIASMTLQALVSLWLVRSELRRRMPAAAAALETG